MDTMNVCRISIQVLPSKFVGNCSGLTLSWSDVITVPGKATRADRELTGTTRKGTGHGALRPTG